MENLFEYRFSAFMAVRRVDALAFSSSSSTITKWKTKQYLSSEIKLFNKCKTGSDRSAASDRTTRAHAYLYRYRCARECWTRSFSILYVDFCDSFLLNSSTMIFFRFFSLLFSSKSARERKVRRNSKTEEKKNNDDKKNIQLSSTIIIRALLSLFMLLANPKIYVINKGKQKIEINIYLFSFHRCNVPL